MKRILSFLKKLLGPKLTKKVRPLGHGLKTYLAALRYGFPARQLTIIGVNGTKGKTTTVAFMGRLANLSGIKTGYITTAVINVRGFQETSPTPQNIARAEFLNPFKMTSIDGFVMQKYLRQMVRNGCRWVVLEMSSQGLEQNRHWGLNGFDQALFLNAYPEHLEAHGGWENYLKCKSKLFKNIRPGGIFLANRHDQQTDYMWRAIPHNRRETIRQELFGRPEDYQITESQTQFKLLQLQDQSISTPFTADFELDNAAFAYQAIALQAAKENLAEPDPQKIGELWNVPGRMEFVVREGQILFHGDKATNVERGGLTALAHVTILVDYAHEPESMRQLLATLKTWRDKKYYTQVIHILSCDGVGRDDWKKPVMGRESFQLADLTVLTTDNYEEGDDPQDIVDLLAKELPAEQLNDKYYKIADRRDAFRQALALAKQSEPGTNSIIVSTGVGSEQGLTRPGGKLEWDERQVWVEECVSFGQTA